MIVKAPSDPSTVPLPPSVIDELPLGPTDKALKHLIDVAGFASGPWLARPGYASSTGHLRSGHSNCSKLTIQPTHRKGSNRCLNP